MKKLLVCLLGASLAIGCTRSSERGGGTERRDSFTLRGPATSTTIAEGEVQTVSLTVDRGKDFNQTVKLSAEAPFNFAPEFDHNVIRPNDNGEVKMKILVAKETEPGTHTLRVIGTPEQGNATALELKVNVKERAAADNRNDNRADDRGFTLSGPRTSTTIKRGETKTIDLTMDRKNDFRENVKFSWDAPKDLKVTIEPNAHEAATAREVRMMVSAPDEAPLGDQTIRVTATPQTGNPHTLDVKVSVQK